VDTFPHSGRGCRFIGVWPFGCSLVESFSACFEAAAADPQRILE